MRQHVPPYLQHQYSLHDRGTAKNLTNSCNYSEKVLSIDHSGNCFLCTCEAWLPISVGNILDFEKLDDVWQNPIAIELNNDLKNKKFSYCSSDICGIKQHDQIQQNYYISVNIDESCNLRCPSCRSELININQGTKFDEKIKISKHITKLLSNFHHPATINMSGNGDTFSSMVYRPIILNTVPNILHQYRIMTNGLLLKKILPKTSIFGRICEFNISVDAGEKETYEKVRLGGKWEILIDNLKWLKQNTSVKISLNYVLQNKNFQSLLAFEKLLERLDVYGFVSKIEDWGTFSNFDQQNVLNKTHQNFKNCMDICKKISFAKLIFQPELKDLIKKYS